MSEKIFVAGHNGMVGSAICRHLRSKKEGLLLVTKSHQDLDLTNQAEVDSFFEASRPDQVYLAAARVGGIHANNTYPADFIYDNLMIQANVIHSAFKHGVKKLLFLGSSCIYPKFAEQPISEKSLLTGLLEATNEPYAIAKIAGIKLCESYNRQYEKSHGIDYRSVMPTNLYGPGDNYHPVDSHVLPALLRRFHSAKIENLKSVTVWGTGKVFREFLYVDDMASASIHVMDLPVDVYLAHTQSMMSHVNVGFGEDLSISSLAEQIAEVVGYQGEIVYDATKPDGTPRKLLDSGVLKNLGWMPTTHLRDGLAKTYLDFLARHP